MKFFNKRLLSAAIAPVICSTAYSVAHANPELVYDFTPGVDSTYSIELEVASDKLSILTTSTDIKEYAIGLDGELTQVAVDSGHFEHVAQIDGKTYVAKGGKIYEENDKLGYTLVAEWESDYSGGGVTHYNIDNMYVKDGNLQVVVMMEDYGSSWVNFGYYSQILDTKTYEITSGESYVYGEPSGDLARIYDPDFTYYVGDNLVFVASAENTVVV